MKIKYTVELARKKFVRDSVKNAYLASCKWFASNVLANEKLNGVQAEYIKDPELCSVTLVMYASINEKDISESHCRICKEIHHAFFINENNNCNMCAAAGYIKRSRSMIKEKAAYYREQLRKEAADVALGNDEEVS